MSSVDLIRHGPVAELRLNNPAKLNALTVGMLDALEAHLTALEATSGIRVILLTSEGERAFCVGADINEWADLPPMEFARIWVRRGHRIFDRLAALPIPTIAVLQGHAFGGGLELAAACDLRVASPKATLALPETGVGIVPGWSGSQRMIKLLPPAIVKEMALTGRRLTAERAASLGFVNAVAEDARGEADTMAAEIVSKSPEATEIAKYMLSAAMGEDSASVIEALGSAVMAASPDKAEGVASFREKRPARFNNG
ncbi:enoyl-CoA hydratase/isomerase family protein [Shimia ponticola]|uniref:enoyl-CoA hydratase/isomerase family protein n=1 Tax=Shimia ponticola TaxID=2582893 RepID=UPI0011BE764A|nr:enoyl-CoA hydratase/isomerase family protein [Shimia ponticola]